MKRIYVLLRAGHVTRMHAVQTLKQHTIAEHVYGMQVWALELCKVNEVTPGKVLEAIVYHDAPECDIGDMPANIKKNNRKIELEMERLEQDFFLTNGIGIPTMSIIELAIVNAADRLDLAQLCLEEYFLGNSGKMISIIFDRACEYALASDPLPLGVSNMVAELRKEWCQHA
jgi:5'-deoxynucleotidase YfbR-like HD superfamily hydrolase